MSANVLVTGAAGYIGGSVLARLMAEISDLCSKTNIFAAVRSPGQVNAVAELGINVIHLDLSDEASVEKAILSNKINIVLHTASSFTPEIASHLIKALGKRGKESSEQTSIVHASIAAMFTPEGGWPHGQIKDSDPTIVEKQKNIKATAGAQLVLDTNILVADLAKQLGVKSFNVVVPTVYGRGSGQWRRLSVKIPAILRENMSSRVVHKYERDAHETAVHIDDLSALYALILRNILLKTSIPSGRQGYYFCFAHTVHWWQIMDDLSVLLSKRGLIDGAKVLVWPSDEMAAEKLGFPVQSISPMLSNSGDMVAVNPYTIGWKPQWDEKRFMASLDDEIRDVLEADTVKPTLFTTLMS